VNKRNSETMLPKSSTFHSLLNLKPPSLHQTPDSVPCLEDWPLVKSLPVPSSTKSFLIKLFMNALPTANRLAHTAYGKNLLCPLCSQPLTSSHFFSSSSCAEMYSTKIFKFCEKHSIPKPKFLINFDGDYSHYDLIYVNTIWKTLCSATHSPKSNVRSLNQTAKTLFKREIQIANILFPQFYPLKSVPPIALRSLPEQYQHITTDTSSTDF